MCRLQVNENLFPLFLQSNLLANSGFRWHFACLIASLSPHRTRLHLLVKYKYRERKSARQRSSEYHVDGSWKFFCFNYRNTRLQNWQCPYVGKVRLVKYLSRNGRFLWRKSTFEAIAWIPFRNYPIRKHGFVNQSQSNWNDLRF